MATYGRYVCHSPDVRTGVGTNPTPFQGWEGFPGFVAQLRMLPRYVDMEQLRYRQPWEDQTSQNLKDVEGRHLLSLPPPPHKGLIQMT